MLIFGISSESAAHDTSSALQTDKLSAFMCQAPKLETSGLDSLETSGLDRQLVVCPTSRWGGSWKRRTTLETNTRQSVIAVNNCLFVFGVWR